MVTSRLMLVLTCLVLVTSVMTSSDHVTYWQPSKWLNDFEPSNSGLKVLVVTDTNETMTRLLHSEQLTNCEIRVDKLQLELEITRLKQESSEQKKDAEILRLKVKHAEQTSLLKDEKLAALEDTSRYKRELDDFNTALSRLESKLREEFLQLKVTNSEETRAELEVQHRNDSEQIMELLTQNVTNLNAKMKDFESRISKIQNQNDIVNVIFNLTSGNCDDVRNIKQEILKVDDRVTSISDHQTKYEEHQEKFRDNSNKEIMKNITVLLALQSLEIKLQAENCSSQIIAAEKKIQQKNEEILKEINIIKQDLNIINATHLLNSKEIEGLKLKMSYIDHIYLKENKYNITGLYLLDLNEVVKEIDILENEQNTTGFRLQNAIQKLDRLKSQLSTKLQLKHIVIKGVTTSLAMEYENLSELKNRFDVDVKTLNDARERMGLIEQKKKIATIRTNLIEITRQITDLEKNVVERIKVIQKVLEHDLIQLGDHFYHFGNNMLQKSWHDAQAHCRSLGLELISLETKEENNLVNAHRLKHFGGNYYMWLGGTDEGHEGRWMWSGTRQNLGFTNWCPSYPNGGTKENCMFICSTSNNGSWCDYPCSHTFYLACELHEI